MWLSLLHFVVAGKSAFDKKNIFKFINALEFYFIATNLTSSPVKNSDGDLFLEAPLLDGDKMRHLLSVDIYSIKCTSDYPVTWKPFQVKSLKL